jgi:glycosyltransferase involved in cell wall biosynthesis
VLVVSGIWPPDVGGPASHGPDVAAFLTERGHEVRALVAADAQPGPQPFPVEWVSRSLPKGAVHAAAAAAVARRARTSDVVYTTGMFGRTALACRALRTPYVVKLTGDPAFERARWRNRVGGDVETFQRGGGGLEGAALRRFRDATLRGAAHVVCPSGFLRDLALTWGLPPERVSVLPNPAPPAPSLPPREELRASLGVDGLLFAFAGRLGPQKALEVALAAVERVPGATLLVAGDGDRRAALEAAAGPHTRFLGPLGRERVLELFAASDASVLPSSWENFPHAVVEALAVGAPVIATAVGGVPEVVEDGVNGLLVPPNDVDAFAEALSRFASDADLRARLRAAAAPSVARFARGTVYGELERLLEAAVR